MKFNTFSKFSGKNMKIAVLVARFNRPITERLEEGARRALRETGVPEKSIMVCQVPGSFELPFVAARIAAREKIDAIICLGAIIKGETKHDEHIARAVAQGIMQINITYNVPVIFGVLTTNNLKQALERAKPDNTNKGYEAAMSAIEMAHLFRTKV